MAWEVEGIRGRIAGIVMDADQAFAAAQRIAEYWYSSDGGRYSVWQGSRHIQIVDTFPQVKRVIIADFETMLLGTDRKVLP